LVNALIYGYDAPDGSLRALGVVAILDVLGTLVTLAIGVFGRDEGTLTVALSPEVAARLRARSRETGRPVRDQVDEAVSCSYGVPVD
jgi:hypothetical protein